MSAEYGSGIVSMSFAMFSSLLILSWFSIVYGETFRAGITYLALLVVSMMVFMMKVADLPVPIEFIGFKDEPGEDLAVGSFTGIMISLPIMAGLVPPACIEASPQLATIVIVAAPLVEEMFFRGLILPTVSELINPYVALASQAVLFALYHVSVWGDTASSLLMGVLMGILFGALALWRESIEAPIMAHIMFNFVSVIWGTLGGVCV